MIQVLINSFIIYMLIATFVLVNLLFNKKMTFTMINKKTGKRIEQIPWYIYINFSLWWIILLPLAIKVGMRDE